jgi:hypothetical protein
VCLGAGSSTGIKNEKIKKNTFFEKQSGEDVENKSPWPKNKAEQTEKQSGEVVENIRRLKKQSGKQTGPCC